MWGLSCPVFSWRRVASHTYISSRKILQALHKILHPLFYLADFLRVALCRVWSENPTRTLHWTLHFRTRIEHEFWGRQRKIWGRQIKIWRRENKIWGRQRKTRGRQRKIGGRLRKIRGRLRKTRGRLRKTRGRLRKIWGRERKIWGRERKIWGRQILTGSAPKKNWERT